MAFNIFRLIFAAALNLLLVNADFIRQVAPVGQNPQLLYNLLNTGGQSDCVTLAASGVLGAVNVSFYFNANNDVESWPSDMYLTVNATAIKGDNTACYQWGGYDVNVCQY